MTHHAGGGLDHADGEQCARPADQGGAVRDADAFVDGTADDRRHHRLRHHPDDPEGDRPPTAAACEEMIHHR
ncbi:MAG: hypothetical protein WKF83_13975 [Nocardioidaceae bacterium]